jgi:hypothetical protein
VKREATVGAAHGAGTDAGVACSTGGGVGAMHGAGGGARAVHGMATVSEVLAPEEG